MKKKILLTVSIITLYTISVFGQTKYEYCNISFSPNEQLIYVTIDNKEFTEIKVDIPKNERTIFNCKPLFDKVKEFQDKGWEIISCSDVVFGNLLAKMAYMKKKLD